MSSPRCSNSASYYAVHEGSWAPKVLYVPRLHGLHVHLGITTEDHTPNVPRSFSVCGETRTTAYCRLRDRLGAEGSNLGSSPQLRYQAYHCRAGAWTIKVFYVKPGLLVTDGSQLIECSPQDAVVGQSEESSSSSRTYMRKHGRAGQAVLLCGFRLQ
ncbi:hypothetical protein BD310DRAFT_661859 [Dichomitus squalens]|uniref:Uncharacterized protein n=1 Tax=Dichomitus squalens TaxID=114155 RepID=A0A4Q9Q6I4_9APHY|nr:hypothetical protein BD310DRAFT_661859 [Dichomitus squalens]